MYTYWNGPARWINSILVAIVTIIGIDTLLRLLDANEANGIVALFRTLAGGLLVPFTGMFPAETYVLTALVAVIGYSLLAAMLIAIVRGFDRPERVVVDRRPVERETVTERRSDW